METKISITEPALKKIAGLKDKQEESKKILRVGVKGGGCSGFSYSLEFVEFEKENDIVQEYDDLKVVCDPKSMEYLNGMEIYFDTNLLHGGLKFRNPNATKSCSCGESFSV